MALKVLGVVNPIPDVDIPIVEVPDELNLWGDNRNWLETYSIEELSSLLQYNNCQDIYDKWAGAGIIYLSDNFPKLYIVSGSQYGLAPVGVSLSDDSSIGTGGSYGGTGSLIVIGYQPSSNKYSIANVSITYSVRQYARITNESEAPNDLKNFSPKLPVNFFRSIPPRDEEIILARGQSIEVGFTIVYEGEGGEPYTGVVTWYNPYPDEISISDNIITVSETAKNPSVMLTAYPSEHEEGDSLYDFVVINVSNPLGIYDTGGTTGGVNQTGGGGSYGRLPDGSIEQSDIIDIPAGTVASPATATGFFTRYLADTNTISTFGRWLWTTDLGLQVAKAVISLIYGDPAQSVISLMSYPFNIAALPGVLQSTGNIIWGNFNSNIPADVLNSQASQIDWGTIQLEEYWGNFLDYAPHTKVSLYLPWGTGFVDLDPGECLPGTLNVKTNIDFSKGSCVHNVIGNGNLIGSFAGHCAQQIPVLSSDFASKVAGLVTAAAAGISASAVGGAGVLAEAAMGFPNATISGGDDKVLASFSDAKRAAGRIATTSLAINRHPVNVTRNGGFTDGSAALGCQYPYVIISRPKQSMPEKYGNHFGYPSNIYRQLVTLRGYTEVGEIHLEGIPATDAELSELDRILKGGVIF